MKKLISCLVLTLGAFAVYANEGDKILGGLAELFMMAGIIGAVVVGLILWLLITVLSNKSKQKIKPSDDQLLDDNLQ